MDTVKKAHPYLRKILLISYCCSILCLILYILFKYEIYLFLLILFLIVMGICEYRLQKSQSQQLQYLIQNAEAIIDQKPLDIIDGEGEISLLSHKLYILNKRYYSLTEKMKQEQMKLKDYIEDISHQLKTPITSMRLNEELLLERLTDVYEKQKIKQIYQQTLKINNLVNDLLTLAKLDSNSIQFQFEDYPIELLIEDVEENLEYLLVQNDVQIQLHHHQEAVLCDQEWLGEAIENIMKNAIEKNPHTIIDVYIRDYEATTMIQIQDHGTGFLEEDIPHLFERFYRGKRNDYHGVGIGLALAKEIIEKHHGVIQAMNKDGALVEISLPKILAKKKV